jgi:hypothetical protein
LPRYLDVGRPDIGATVDSSKPVFAPGEALPILIILKRYIFFHFVAEYTTTPIGVKRTPGEQATRRRGAKPVALGLLHHRNVVSCQPAAPPDR